MKALAGLACGIILSLVLVSFAGESPLHVVLVLFKSAFGSKYDIGLTLFYTTSLIFTGLSVCIAFHAGLFNIGAEGQLNIGAFAMAATALSFPHLPLPLAPILAVLAGVTAAAAWGFIPGILKATRDSHEVIITMMMNFVAFGLVNYFVVGPFKNPLSQNPETAELPTQFLLRSSEESPFNFSFYVALCFAILIWFFLRRTVWGYELRVVGGGDDVARVSGINPRKYKVLALTLSGALAGLVGLNEVIASAGKLRLGFSADFGFVGIAVALLARNHPLAIIFSAFLFGSLQKGAADLDFETAHVTKDFAKILQAIIILSVAGFTQIDFERAKRWLKRT
jgi:general nucleoside transport system permease protein